MKERHKKIIAEYKEIATNIKYIIEKRKEIISRHFNEILQPTTIQKKDLESRISELIPKEPTHPTVFIASTLGFTKSNWNKTIEKMLCDMGLVTRLRYCSYKNLKQYEKLKILIIKYLDKKYKR